MTRASFVTRYTQWLNRRRTFVLLLAVLISIVSIALTAKLELRADFSHLLPPETRSVKDLEALKARIDVPGTVFVVIEHESSTLREQAATNIASELKANAGKLIASVTLDRGNIARFAWKHRFLYAELSDLEKAEQALRDQIARSKLKASPFFIDLEDEEEDTERSELDNLHERLDEAKAAANTPEPFISEDGTLQLLIIETSFGASKLGKGKRLMAIIDRAVTKARSVVGPALHVGLTGNVTTTIHEQRSILRGMLMAAGITVVLSAMALLFFYRSFWAVAAELVALSVGSLMAFGLAEVFIGHLNLATAFLAAIVVGNGINPGLILLARYQEEQRKGHEGGEALQGAILGAFPGTVTASATASVAYASLIITDFRGFRHFGLIGGIGMLTCWLAAFTVLPALLLSLESRGRLPITQQPALGQWIRSLASRRPERTMFLAALLVVASSIAACLYVYSQPLEEDWRNLRSTGTEVMQARTWNRRITNEIGGGHNQNISGRFAVLARDAAQARQVELLLLQGNMDPKAPLFAFVRTIDSLLPVEQERKLAVLGEIRTLIDENGLGGAEEDEADLRPPDEITLLRAADIPAAIAGAFVEKDGRRGRIVVAASSSQYDTWNVRHQVNFAYRVREIELPAGTKLGGQAFVFSDILTSMEHDGPIATLVAILASALLVLVMFGGKRYAWIVLASTACGIVGMVALVSIFGIKVNFLDFIALPITIGIGIDYAANMAARHRQEPSLSAKGVLSSTGAAVVICSFTTTVGYGSLLLSDNAGIRSFGLAAVLGEIACLSFALILVPTLLCRRVSS